MDRSPSNFSNYLGKILQVFSIAPIWSLYHRQPFRLTRFTEERHVADICSQLSQRRCWLTSMASIYVDCECFRISTCTYPPMQPEARSMERFKCSQNRNVMGPNICNHVTVLKRILPFVDNGFCLSGEIYVQEDTIGKLPKYSRASWIRSLLSDHDRKHSARDIWICY